MIKNDLNNLDILDNLNILVTGGAGFLGSHIADFLSESGHNVSILDIVHSQYLRRDQKEFVGSILDREFVKEAIKDIDVIYHLAAISDIDVAEKLPYQTIEVNVLGTINVLEAARKYNIKRIIFASSIYVYSRTGSFYRISKHACELLLEEYKEKYGLRFTILRFGTLYGPRSDNHNSIYRYLKNALERGLIEFNGTGEEIREYINVKDCAHICAKILNERYAGESIILTGPHRIKVIDLLLMIKEILGGKVEILHNPQNSTSHYNQTPYSYLPRVGRKITSDSHCDLGQSLIEILEEIDHTTNKEYVSSNTI